MNKITLEDLTINNSLLLFTDRYSINHIILHVLLITGINDRFIELQSWTSYTFFFLVPSSTVPTIIIRRTVDHCSYVYQA